MFLFACNSKLSKKEEEEGGATTSATKVKAAEQDLFIKDSADYSPDFLESLVRSEWENISLVDSFLIIENVDTFLFPITPEMGKQITLTARNKDVAVGLIIKRVSQSSINYRLEMIEYGKASFSCEGQAHLSPHFFLASESTESSFSGDSYLVTEYHDNKDSCYFYIKLGKEEGSDPRLLASIVKNCNKPLADLDSFPSLIEK
jgi:hypothetical protein